MLNILIVRTKVPRVTKISQMFLEEFSDYSKPKRVSIFNKGHKYSTMTYTEFLKKLVPKNERNYALNLFIPDIVIFERVQLGKNSSSTAPKTIIFNQFTKDLCSYNGIGMYQAPYKVLKQKD